MAAHGKLASHPVVCACHYASEFLATFLFVGLLSLAILAFFGMPELTEAWGAGGFARTLGVVGVCVATLVGVIYSPLGKISGAHVNPAVSLAFWMEGLLRTRDFLAYVAAQVAGATLACLLLAWAFPAAAERVSLGVSGPVTAWHPALTAFAVELLLTGLLISLLFHFLHSNAWIPYTGAAVGVFVFVAALVTSGLVGLSLNPARSLAPALVMGKLDHLWIYLTAPFLGAFLTVHAHRMCSLLKHPTCYRLCHREGYVERLFQRYVLDDPCRLGPSPTQSEGD